MPNNDQNEGKIYSKSEANSLYGPVLDSADFTMEKINGFISKTSTALMFKFINKEVVVLGNGRNLIFPDNAKFTPTDVFSVFSISLLKDLFNLGKLDTVTVEQRESVLSITVGNYTAEKIPNCPPFCP